MNRSDSARRAPGGTTTKAYRRRREFLKRSLGCTLVGAGAGAMSGKLGLVGSALAQSGGYAGLADYKALVCVFLYGGSDSFNLFLPDDDALVDAYAASRGALALAPGRVAATATGGVRFSDRLPELASMYDAGRLAVVGNVGNLVVPVTRSGLEAGTASIPTDLFAHNHQQEQWLKGWSSRPTGLVGTGWGGRMADLLEDANAGAALPPTFSVAGANHFQPGARTAPVAVNPVHGPRPMYYLDPSVGGARNAARADALARIVALEETNALQRFAGDAHTRALDSSQLLAGVLAANPGSADPGFGASGKLGEQLRMVARLIAGRDALAQKRQIFFVGLGGWDTHDAQTVRLDALAGRLDAGLAAFQRELDAQGVADSVTTFTASDFGRTLTVNGDGSDHGWGGHYAVMGGAVSGGRFVGSWPSYRDRRRGRRRRQGPGHPVDVGQPVRRGARDVARAVRGRRARGVPGPRELRRGLDRRLRAVRRDLTRGPGATRGRLGGDSGRGRAWGSTRIGVPGGAAGAARPQAPSQIVTNVRYPAETGESGRRGSQPDVARCRPGTVAADTSGTPCSAPRPTAP